MGIEPATLRLPDDCSYCLSHVAAVTFTCTGHYVFDQQTRCIQQFWDLWHAEVGGEPLLRVCQGIWE
ncbi:hypothetical protein COCON_G00076100 [Conger conger]|uniref:Uncharacterized protein n=1 Tax=Conger conger TaxID=82655 RepID=A0A9Q1I251_CONCO|nr:hypothetical protein COCON_G00076100 [Conger conger]